MTDEQIERELAEELGLKLIMTIWHALCAERERRKELERVLLSVVWRDRTGGDKFCVLCGAGAAHAARFGHLDTCALHAAATAREKE